MQMMEQADLQEALSSLLSRSQHLGGANEGAGFQGYQLPGIAPSRVILKPSEHNSGSSSSGMNERPPGALAGAEGDAGAFRALASNLYALAHMRGQAEQADGDRDGAIAKLEADIQRWKIGMKGDAAGANQQTVISAGNASANPASQEDTQAGSINFQSLASLTERLLGRSAVSTQQRASQQQQQLSSALPSTLLMQQQQQGSAAGWAGVRPGTAGVRSSTSPSTLSNTNNNNAQLLAMLTRETEQGQLMQQQMRQHIQMQQQQQQQQQQLVMMIPAGTSLPAANNNAPMHMLMGQSTANFRAAPYASTITPQTNILQQHAGTAFIQQGADQMMHSHLGTQRQQQVMLSAAPSQQQQPWQMQAASAGMMSGLSTPRTFTMPAGGSAGGLQLGSQQHADYGSHITNSSNSTLGSNSASSMLASLPVQMLQNVAVSGIAALPSGGGGGAGGGGIDSARPRSPTPAPAGASKRSGASRRRKARMYQTLNALVQVAGNLGVDRVIAQAAASEAALILKAMGTSPNGGTGMGCATTVQAVFEQMLDQHLQRVHHSLQQSGTSITLPPLPPLAPPTTTMSTTNNINYGNNSYGMQPTLVASGPSPSQRLYM